METDGTKVLFDLFVNIKIQSSEHLYIITKIHFNVLKKNIIMFPTYDVKRCMVL